jgi:hypothetical protein
MAFTKVWAMVVRDGVYASGLDWLPQSWRKRQKMGKAASGASLTWKKVVPRRVP